MTASSQYRKVADIQKEKKVERRNALEGRKKPENNQQEHQEIKIGGVSAETSSSDIPVQSKEKAKKKAPAKKASAKKK
jgi:hypothetical protein|tara:strand:+ start:1155 stop:1388 length:234 start_codon:yes stop_codon:yes gene_type:complete